ncbi:MAG: zinc-ribbon domain-containing protein [Sphingomicrobium sp.]
MILTCPNCGTQYVVKDGAIPPEGRQVRCAACKHSWHQDPESAAAPETQSEGSSAAEESVADTAPQNEAEASAEDEGLAEATMIDPRSGPEAEERAYEEAAIEADAEPDQPEARADAAGPGAEEWNEPPHAEVAPDVFSPFAENGEVEPRRHNPLLTILVIVFIVIAAAALFWFFAPPDLKARLGLATAGTSPLTLVITHRDRQQLESGNQLLTVTGRVINPTAKEQSVPPIEAQLLGPGGKVVYSWTIDPPARSLAAGASASFNSAEVNVPPGGDDLRITLGSPKL